MNPTDNLMAKIIFLKNIKKKKIYLGKKTWRRCAWKNFRKFNPIIAWAIRWANFKGYILLILGPKFMKLLLCILN
jgi:hypothetical protein